MSCLMSARMMPTESTRQSEIHMSTLSDTHTTEDGQKDEIYRLTNWDLYEQKIEDEEDEKMNLRYVAENYDDIIGGRG